MKSLNQYNDYPTSLPLLSDDITEFHAARILLLVKLCGQGNTIDGLTKMAKLDFFVRYPKFFEVACKELGKDYKVQHGNIDSHMVRFHYGPWDQRYYHVLSYLESKNLLNIQMKGNTFILSLTSLGNEMATSLQDDSSYGELCAQMSDVKQALGSLRGTELKELIYKLFDKEVAKLPLKKVIE